MGVSWFMFALPRNVVSLDLAGLKSKVVEKDMSGSHPVDLHDERYSTDCPPVVVHFIDLVSIDGKDKMRATGAHLQPVPLRGICVGWKGSDRLPTIFIRVISNVCN